MKSSRRLMIITLVLGASNLPAAMHYVSPGSSNPTPPYSNWVTAARNIQNAVDAAAAGDEIVVTNGIYATSGRPVGTNVLVNQVAVDRPVTLRSVNGAQFTVIDGGGTNRCAYLVDGASLTGFTLTNGYCPGVDGGAGVWCSSANATLTNCTLTGNFALQGSGGGASRGTLYNCMLSGNTALVDGGGAFNSGLTHCTLIANSAFSSISVHGGGAFNCNLTNCTLDLNVAWGGGGGGAAGGTLINCTLTRNGVRRTAFSTVLSGGGAYGCTLYNCALFGNGVEQGSTIFGYGGGAEGGTLYNCTLAGNGSVYGGGADSSTLNNCIIYFNSCAVANGGSNYNNCTLSSCCTQPFGAGVTVLSDPMFVNFAGGNLRLQPNSPCINAGNNTFVITLTDLDGRPRIVGGRVDMGAYEFQGPFNQWLQSYGLPIDGSADFIDSDGDGMNNWQEWVCGTNPTNALSVLRMISVVPAGANVTMTWQSVAGMNYLLEESASLGAPFTLVAAIVGQSGSTAYIRTNPPWPGAFYRVGVSYR